MKLLLDECLPRRTKYLFVEAGHECETVQEAGFSGKENGELIALAENEVRCLRHDRQEHPASTKPQRPEYRRLDYPYSFKRPRRHSATYSRRALRSEEHGAGQVVAVGLPTDGQSTSARFTKTVKDAAPAQESTCQRRTMLQKNA